jgi:hypothetical protein
MKLSSAALLLAGVTLAAGAHAQWAFSAGGGIQHMELKEYDTIGRELVREHGWMPGLDARADYAREAWRFGLQASTWRGSIPYDGRLQSGSAFISDTSTTQDRITADVAYRLSDTLSTIGGIEWEHRTRTIHGSGSANGLDERTTSWHLLAGLRTRLGQLAGCDVDLTAMAVAAQPEHLQVRFDNHAYDEARLSTKPATGLRASLSILPSSMPRLSATLEFDWMRVRRSDDAMLSTNGMPAGTVAQPEHRRRTLSAWMRYRFN